MADPISSEFTKMEIKAYEYNKKTGAVSNVKKMKVGINPTDYKLGFKIPNNSPTDVKKADGSNYVPKIIELKETLDFTLTLDSSGVIPNTNEVYLDMQWISDNLARLDGSVHSTRYVDISWGSLQFRWGQLKKCDFSCNYFSRSGSPVRAKVSLSFERVVDWSVSEKQSPDLTHMRVVRDGDTLPLMCEEIYKSPNYYARVAEVNGLANFMNLQPGQALYFPPLKPEE